MSTKAVDAIPLELHSQYLSLMKDRGVFWYDMAKLCLDFGLRNIEARELRAEHIDLERGIILLSDSKQVRSYVTKTTNKQIQKQWLIEGRRFLRTAIGGELAPLLVRMCTTVDQLEALAQEYDLFEEYNQAREQHYATNVEQVRAEVERSAPKGRVIDFSRYHEAKRILKARVAKYGAVGGYLFPACELRSNRAKGQGYEPVSRQSVYRVVQSVGEALKAVSGRCREALKGIRLGLHSARKAAVQKVANTIDMMAASLWIGHGNGSGDIATTQRYLDRSEKRINAINNQLAAMVCDG